MARSSVCSPSLALALVLVISTAVFNNAHAAAVFMPFWKRFCSFQPRCTCTFQSIKNSGVTGRVEFQPVWHRGTCQTLITGTIQGLAPGAVQGMHVHAKGDASTVDGSGLGGHFTHPYGQKTLHGMPVDQGHDWGDLGNIEANSQGVATYRRIDSTISWTNALLGRGMIVHAKKDKGRPFAAKNGDAGPRVAQCVIGIL